MTLEERLEKTLVALKRKDGGMIQGLCTTSRMWKGKVTGSSLEFLKRSPANFLISAQSDPSSAFDLNCKIINLYCSGCQICSNLLWQQ